MSQAVASGPAVAGGNGCWASCSAYSSCSDSSLDSLRWVRQKKALESVNVVVYMFTFSPHSQVKR